MQVLTALPDMARQAYRSHCVAEGSGPHGLDTSPSYPAAGNRSSSPGFHFTKSKWWVLLL